LEQSNEELYNFLLLALILAYYFLLAWLLIGTNFAPGRSYLDILGRKTAIGVTLSVYQDLLAVIQIGNAALSGFSDGRGVGKVNNFRTAVSGFDGDTFVVLPYNIASRKVAGAAIGPAAGTSELAASLVWLSVPCPKLIGPAARPWFLAQKSLFCQAAFFVLDTSIKSASAGDDDRDHNTGD